MRRLTSFAALFLALATTASHPALADSRTFVIANQPDGYGIDQCLARGEKCGAKVASAYCRSQNYTEATTFGRISRDDVTGTTGPQASSCMGNLCIENVAITCQR